MQIQEVILGDYKTSKFYIALGVHGSQNPDRYNDPIIQVYSYGNSFTECRAAIEKHLIAKWDHLIVHRFYRWSYV